MSEEYLLVIRPNMDGRYPSVCGVVRDALSIWTTLMPDKPVPRIFMIFKQEPYDLLLTFVSSMKEIGDARNVQTENATFHAMGPMDGKLVQTLVDEMGNGIEDAGLFPRRMERHLLDDAALVEQQIERHLSFR